MEISSFIEKAKKIHNRKYEYNNISFSTKKDKIEIFCNLHGIFSQSVEKHLVGNGCPSCGKISTVNKKRENFIKNKDNLIQKFNQIHNNKYDYSKVEIKTAKDKILIICPTHGTFSQYIYIHTDGNGCSKCSKIKSGSTRTKSTSQIVDEFTKIHGNKYDYSKVVYTGILNNVIITCKVHGDFLQMPTEHIKGHACRKCNGLGGYTMSYFYNDHRKNKKAKMYLINFKNSKENFYKIGITIQQNVKIRFNHNRKGYNVTYLQEISGTLFELYKLEQNLLNTVLSDHLYKPLTKIGGDSECFIADTNLLDDINLILNLSKN